MAKKKKTGKELEKRVADAYRAMGTWKVEHDKKMAGNQIDVYVELETPGHLLHRIAVEAKDYAKPVGVAIVNDFAVVAKLLRQERLVDEGIIVSVNGFTTPARDAAETHGIRLLEIADLEAQAEEAKAEGRTRPTKPPIAHPPPTLPTPTRCRPTLPGAWRSGARSPRGWQETGAPSWP